jgi:hypothetical protein
MTSPSYEQEITSHLHKLSLDQQMQVLSFMRTLMEDKPPGVPGTELLRFSGCIDLDDLKAMKNAITEGCEKVSLNDW